MIYTHFQEKKNSGQLVVISNLKLILGTNHVTSSEKGMEANQELENEFYNLR